MATTSDSSPDMGRQGTVRMAITEQIADMRPGERLPSIRNLMDTYGVTQVTIERCLGYLEGRGSIVRKPRSGTFVADVSAQSGPSRNGKTLGVIIPSFVLPGSGSFLEGIEEAAAAEGWMIQVCNAARGLDHELQFFQRCAQIGTKALIVYPSSWNILSDEYCDQVRRFVWSKKLSVVSVDLAIPGVGCDLATGDDVAAYECAAEILLEQGRTQICYCEAVGGLISAKRFAGVVKAVQSHGNGASVRRVAADLDRVQGDDQHVEATANRLADHLTDDLDAVIVGSTPLLPAVKKAIDLRGRNIGEDIAVAASMADSAAPPKAPIIQLRLPNRKIGRKAFELMLNRINQPDRAPVEARIPFEIINPYEKGTDSPISNKT